MPIAGSASSTLADSGTPVAVRDAATRQAAAQPTSQPPSMARVKRNGQGEALARL